MNAPAQEPGFAASSRRWHSLMLCLALAACSGRAGTSNPDAPGAATLSLSVNASPASGAVPLSGVSITITKASGNQAGDLSCAYSCDADAGGAYVPSPSGTSPLTIASACSYQSPGNHTIGVRCQQGQASATSMATVASAAGSLYSGPCEDGRGSGMSIVYTNTRGPKIEGKTQSSVGFAFSCDGGPCLCGTFADGHTFWVAPPSGASGSVHLDGFAPARCSGCAQPTGAGSTLRNGWLANPTGDMNVYRGMDGRLGAVDQPSPLVPTAAQPYAVDTTAPGFVARMIIKADSDLDTGDDCYGGGATTQRMCLEYFNAIAVLARAPADNGATVLRPALYGGSDAQKELLSTAQLDLAQLPAMNIVLRPSLGAPVGQGWDGSLEALLEPRMEWLYDWPGTEASTAARNSSTASAIIDNGYGPTKHKPINEALLWLTFDPTQQGGSAAKKRLLAIRAAELGMDICGALLYGGNGDDSPGEYGGWPANGGHSAGRFARAVVAATLLHHPACLAALRKTADNHGQSFCQGGSDAGKRCGDHWGIAGCRGGACVASTAPAQICDEHLASFAETGQHQHANTHGAIGAGIALYGVWNSLAHPMSPTGNNPIYADVEGWIDGGSNDENQCPGQYQDIVWPAFQVQFAALKAIPATWPYVNPTFFEYMDRMYRVGVHCAPDNRVNKVGGDQSGNTAQVTQLCAGGSDAGRPCLADGDCSDGTCSAKGPLHTRPGTNYYDPDYGSLQSLYQYEVNKDCYHDCSCAGMKGLCVAAAARRPPTQSTPAVGAQ